MKLQIELQPLKSTIAKVIGAVQKRNTIPALANVAITASGSVVTLKATDLDLEVTAQIPATVETEGATTVNAQLLSSIVGKMPAGKIVSMALADNKLTVSAGRSKYDLHTLPIEDFPVMASEQYQSTFSIQAPELSRLFNMAKFAASADETKYYLNGIYLHSADSEIRAVATDGHKFAKISLNMDADFEGVIVPSKSVSEIVKSLDMGDVSVSVSATKIRFDMGDTVIVSKVIDGTFPDYERVIPDNHDKTMTASAAEIKAASDRVAIVADDRSRAVKVELSRGVATMRTRGAIGEAEETVEIDYSGPDFAFGVNSKYLAEALSQCNGSDVTIEMGSDINPITIKPSDDDGALYVIMPMRV